MNYNKLSEEALEASNSKGFTFTSIEQSLALIISEISEALEADRSNLRADRVRFDSWMISPNTYEHDFVNAFSSFYKNTVEDEFADTAIRLFLLAAHLKVDFKRMNPCKYYRAFERFTFAENAFALTKGLCRDHIAIEKRILFGITYLESWAAYMKISLGYHIKMKMKYNSTRPMMHDKNY